MAKPKPRVKLESWSVFGGKLVGVVYGHPFFEDGTGVTTSTVLSPPDNIKEGGEIVTKHTIYQLGKKYQLPGENRDKENQ